MVRHYHENHLISNSRRETMVKATEKNAHKVTIYSHYVSIFNYILISEKLGVYLFSASQ